MKKRNRKILSFIIAIAVMGYGFVGYNLVSADTAYAQAEMKIQNTSADCETEDSDCAQEHTEDCSSCVTFHNDCHADYSLVSNNNSDLFNSQYLLNSLDDTKHSNLNYPPEAPPI